MDPEILDYVRATARFLALPLDEAQVERVSAHLARTRVLVAGLQALPLHDELEPAEVFCPAPFPSGDA
jgi:hypothetical protein